MTRYTVFLASPVAEAFSTFKPREKTQLLKLLRRLQSDPFLQGDYTEQDLIGRPMSVIIVGRMAVVFWADHAVKEIKVLDIRPAGH